MSFDNEGSFKRQLSSLCTYSEVDGAMKASIPLTKHGINRTAFSISSTSVADSKKSNSMFCLLAMNASLAVLYFEV